MAKKKISELTAAGTITGTEQVPIVQGGVTKRTTVTGLAGGLNGTYVALVPAPTGVAATDTATLQAATAAALAAGGGNLICSGGTYLLNAQVNIPANTTLRGIGQFTKFQAAGGYASQIIALRGLSDVTLADCAIVGNGVTNQIGVVTQLPNTSDMATRHKVQNVRFTGNGDNAMRVQNPVTDFVFVDNFISGVAGLSFQATDTTASDGIEVSRNHIRNLTSAIYPAIQLYTAAWSRYKHVRITDNDVLGVSGATNSIPIEVDGAEDLIVSGNDLSSTGPNGLGVSLATCIDGIVTGNVIRGQSKWAVEANNVIRLEVSDNTVIDCAALLQETGASTGNSDIKIVDNVCVGTGLGSLVAGSNYIRILGATNAVIEDNYFHNLDYIATAISVGFTATADSAVVRGNRLVADTTNSCLALVQVVRSIDPIIEGNKVKITRNLVAGDDNKRVIAVVQGGAVAGARVESNDVTFTGTVAAAPSLVAIGTDFAGAGVLARSAFIRNRVDAGPVGFRVDSTSADTIFFDNDGRTCTTEVSNINAAVVFVRTKRESGGTVAPTTGTWVQGDRVWNTTPSNLNTGIPGWICTVGGTPGTWQKMSAGIYQPSAGNIKTDDNLDVVGSVIAEGTIYVGTAFDVNISRSATRLLQFNGRALQAGSNAADVVQQTRGSTSQTGNLHEWLDPVNAIYSTVSENGYFTTRKTTIIADAELVAGELAFWFDSTNGASKLMIKAKQADGTVKTASVALA